MEDEKVLCYKDTILRKSDIGILEGPCYLTDEIIAFYFQYLSSKFECDDIEFVRPSVSSLLANFNISPEEAKEIIEPMRLCDMKIVIFPINNCDNETGDEGTHWSTLVYDSTTNMFIHLDSMENTNNDYATKLFEVVKGYVSSKPSSKGKLSSNKKKKKELKSLNKRNVVPDTPGFMEYDTTPQQSNGYDCGLYVLAIAKTICEWRVSRSRGKDTDWLSAMNKHVNVSSVEISMRSQVLMATEELKMMDSNW